MKISYNLIFILIVCFISISIVYSSAVLVDFRAEAGKNKVTLKWSTLSEVNCKEFHIQRGLSENSFHKIAVVKANENSYDRQDYTYFDATVFRPTANTFYYRINIINKDGTNSIFSETVKVKPAVSGVRHTWGSIKALFR